MSSSTRRRRVEYPFSKAGVYVSAVTAALSILLALLLLPENSFALIFYFVLTSILTVVIFAIKVRIFSTRKSKSLENYSLEDVGGSRKWKMGLLIVSFVIAMIMPMIMSKFLDPASWLASLGSFVSGVSLSEVVFYFYCTR